MNPDDERWGKSKAIFENLLKYFSAEVRYQKDSVLLEFGAGKWGFSRFYQEKVDTVYALDIEDYSTCHPGIEFILYDGIEPIPLPDKSIDIVVSHSALEHVRDLDHSLSEINRLLKVGGLAFLTVGALYYSSYGGHLYFDGKRFDNWEHLDPSSKHYMTDNPYLSIGKHKFFLNKLTSSAFWPL